MLNGGIFKIFLGSTPVHKTVFFSEFDLKFGRRYISSGFCGCLSRSKYITHITSFNSVKGRDGLAWLRPKKALNWFWIWFELLQFYFRPTWSCCCFELLPFYFRPTCCFCCLLLFLFELLQFYVVVFVVLNFYIYFRPTCCCCCFELLQFYFRPTCCFELKQFYFRPTCCLLLLFYYFF